MTSMLAPQSQTETQSFSLGPYECAEALTGRVREIQEMIARRAHELFEERGHQHGNDQ